MAPDFNQIAVKYVLKAYSEQEARIADLKAVGADTSDAERALQLIKSDLQTCEDHLRPLTGIARRWYSLDSL
jgi:hypothetical protein